MFSNVQEIGLNFYLNKSILLLPYVHHWVRNVKALCRLTTLRNSYQASVQVYNSLLQHRKGY